MLALMGAALLTVVTAAPVDRYKLGTLEFAPCELSQLHSGATTAAWCAPFEVPENRTAPGGRKLALKLALIRSTAANPKPDPVVLLAGGPGQAATESYPQVAAALAPLLRHRDIVLLDQRGTGGSNKLDCEDKDAKEKRTPAEQEAAAADPARAEAELRACLEHLSTHADPRFYTTTDATGDLEALRRALGGVKFNLVGISYGTRMAQQYIKRHPDGVRSAVLDSVVPNELVLGADFAVNLDAALRARFAVCAKDKACNERFGDIYKTLYEVRDLLETAPQKLAIRDPQNFASGEHTLTADGFSALVRMYAYSPETAAMLPLGISETAKGNPAPLLGQVTLLAGDLSASITGGMELSVICAEDADELRAAAAQPGAAQKRLIFGGRFAERIGEACALWPKGSRPDDFRAPLKTDTPVLVLSGEFDPVTPPRYGDAVVKGAAHGRHLVAPGQGHNVIGRGCMPKLVQRFIEDLDAAALDAGCLAELGSTPFFIDFNGAAP